MKNDKDIWKEKFKNGDTIKDFETVKGPPLGIPDNEEDKKSILENIKFWNKKTSNKNTLEKRVEALEKELTQIKKYLNYTSRNKKRTNNQPNQPQNNRNSNETQS